MNRAIVALTCGLALLGGCADTHSPEGGARAGGADLGADSPDGAVAVEQALGGGRLDQLLDLYLPVGPAGTCQRFDTSECEIYRLTWNDATDTAGPLQTIIATPGAYSPAVSPDGEYLSYDRNNGGTNEVVVHSLADGTEVVAGEGDKSNWRTDLRLAFGTDDQDPSAPIRWSDVALRRILRAPLGTGPMIRAIGEVNPETALDTTNCSADDPYTNPANRDLVAFHSNAILHDPDGDGCPWIRDPTENDRRDPRPIVLDLTASELIEGVSFWRLALGPAGIEGCAHTAFSPDGGRVLCTNQPDTHHAFHRAPLRRIYPIVVNRVYGFELGGPGPDHPADPDRYNSVRGAAPLFDHLLPADLPDIDQIWDQGPGTPDCDTYYTKRAEFCGGDDQIIANVYCASFEGEYRALFSRLFLIEFSDPENPVYTDLTSIVEDRQGVPRGSLGGFAAACHQPDAL